jgi:hypothetical protein
MQTQATTLAMLLAGANIIAILAAIIAAGRYVEKIDAMSRIVDRLDGRVLRLEQHSRVAEEA